MSWVAQEAMTFLVDLAEQVRPLALEDLAALQAAKLATGKLDTTVCVPQCTGVPSVP